MTPSRVMTMLRARGVAADTSVVVDRWWRVYLTSDARYIGVTIDGTSRYQRGPWILVDTEVETWRLLLLRFSLDNQIQTLSGVVA